MIFPSIPRRSWLPYLIALGCFVAAALLRFAFLGGLGTRAPYVTFFPAVMIAVLYGGVTGGLVTSLLSALFSLYFSMEPLGSFAARDSADLIGLALFLVTCLMVSALTELARRAQLRAGEAEAQIRLAVEREKAGLALRQSELKFRSYFENSPAAVFVVDRQGNYVDCNPAAVALLGYPLEELRGMRVPALHLVEEQLQVLETFGTLLEAGRVDLETRLLRADGSPVWVSLRAVLLDDGHAIAYCQDITEQKQAVQSLGERLALREQLASVAATVPGVIYSYLMRPDGSSCFLYASPALEKLYGVSHAEVTRDAQAVLALIHSEDADRVTRSVALSARTLNPWQEQFRINHPRRGVIWVEGHSVPQREPDGSTLWHGFLHDVTHRTLSEEALRASSQFQRQIIDCAEEGIVVFGLDLRYQVWNPYLERFTGLAAVEVLGRHPREVGSFLGSVEVLGHLERVLKGERVGSLEFAFHSELKGRTCWVSQSFSPLRSAQGRVIGVIGVVRDITDRRLVEEELRSSEARFRTLVEQAGDAFFLHTLDGRFLDLNRRACESLGYSREELLRMSVFDLEMELDHQEALGHWRRLEPGEFRTVRGRQRRKDGSTFPVEIRVGRLLGDAETVLLGLVRDISDREHHDELLREASRRMELAISAGGFGIWDLDVVSGALVWSERMFELYGVDPEGFEGTRTAWMQCLHPEDLPRTLAAGDAALEGRAEFDTEFRVVHPDGKVKSLKGNAVVVRDAQGRPLRMIGLNRDITERRSLEAQLVQAQKMEAVGRLAGGVAHDFNNNLTVILGYAELSRLVAIGSETFHDYLGEIIKAAEHSRDITQQLLAFSRNEIIAPRRVDLNDLIRSTHKTLLRLIGEDIRLKLTLPEGLWPLLIDPAQINQIVVNLAVNARDAMPSGGTLSLETRNLSLDAAYCQANPEARPGDWVQLTVSDCGVGMSREMLGHIFEPFFTTKGVGKGTGLGLATVYGIMRQNDGFIEVFSEPGRGAAFALFFPRLSGEGSCEVPAAEALSSGEGVVLLVEDEVSVRQMARLMLESAGYSVLVAATPAEALEFCRRPEQRIDCLLTDVIMPGMNGVELTDAVRSLRPTVGMVYMSGYTADMIAHHGVLSQGVIFVQKPFDARTLSAKVKEAIRAREPS
ncbi:hypothetical protein GMST_06500 [Geomonas silvestris]|uniref:histidine kinase n=1 Tax=Geomonas silvestris TaxID=2740184 RepID=A0A6V8MEB6_9BACT|nr:PAS domain S-box protein [Geomonas silvestris]GFO58325.1 hypothetical protein GMST_06500 [Geomonas silvestris]